MGNSWVEEKPKAEYISLTKAFQDCSPFFISIGMTYDQFWRDDLTIAKEYLKAYRIKSEREYDKEQWNMWELGVYIYEALCDVSPILHAFAKKGTKPLPFLKKPFGIKENKEEKDLEKEKENERLKATIFFKNWARATAKQIGNKGGENKNG